MQTIIFFRILGFLLIQLQALYREEAGVYDWHQQHLGSTSSSNTIAYSQKNVLYASSSTGIVALMSLKTSEIRMLAIAVITYHLEWRLELAESYRNNIISGNIPSNNIQKINPKINQVVIHGQSVLVLSQEHFDPFKQSDGHLGGNFKLSAFSLEGSFLYSTSTLLDQNSKFVKMIVKENAILVLFSTILYRFDTTTGTLLYQHRLAEGSFANLLILDNYLYLVANQRARLHITILDLKSGALVEQLDYSQSHMITSQATILVNQHDYFIVFTSPSGPQFTKISTKISPITSVSSLIGVDCDLVSVATRDRHFQDHFLIKSKKLYQLVKLTPSGNIEIVHSFGKKDGGKSYAYYNQLSELTSVFSFVSRSGSSLYTEIVMLVNGEKEVKVNEAPFHFENTGDIQWISVDFYNKKSVGPLPRFIIGTADGSFHCVKDNSLLWSMEESLTETVSSLFIDAYGVNDKLMMEVKEEAVNKNLINAFHSRVTRHINDVFDFIRGHRIVSKQGKYGFKKLAVFASATGKVVALETEKGTIVWQRHFPDLIIQKLLVTSLSSLSVVGYSKSGPKETFIYQLDSLEGTLVNELVVNDYQIAISSSILDPSEANVQPIILIHPTDSKITTFPTFVKVRLDEPVFFYTTNGLGSKSIQGYSIVKSSESLSAIKTWNLRFEQDETIAALATSSSTNVASLGRVLGTRQVLYKYLNPNLLAVVTAKHTKDGHWTCLYLLDAVSGAIYSRIPTFGTGHVALNANSIHIAMSENFLVYSYWNHGSSKLPVPESPKQYEVTVLELFESFTPDVRFKSHNFSSFSNHKLESISQSYVLSHPISAIGITKTAAGVTSKEILFAYRHGSIVGFNRRLLDPRRPFKAPTAVEKEEGLVPYSPFLAINPKDAATYFKQVLGVQSIKTLPTNLESTSVLLAFGIDIFSTRRTPSKPFDTLSEDFSYIQLVASILLLAAGVYYTNSLVKKKAIRESWA